MALKKIRNIFALAVFIYVVSPVIFRYSPVVQRSLLFMNHINTQYKVNLSHPEQIGIRCSRLLRLKLKNEPNIQLGAWHILPSSSLENCETDIETNRTSIRENMAFSDSRPIILYLHGNGGNRAGDHRNRFYKRLAYELDYHIITFDYRGYGDSTDETPSSHGLSSDATYVYQWLISQKNVDRDRVFVWGHSLGTAVAIRMIAGLPDHLKARKLILEAPFDSLANAIANHPFSTPFRIIPYFEHFFVDPIRNSPELNFDSLMSIGKIKPTSVMILHAQDDAIIPYKLGRNLYEKAVEMLGQSEVQFVSVDSKFGLGHKHICSHDQTLFEVRKFLGSKLSTQQLKD